jgi:hypothetical protein
MSTENRGKPLCPCEAPDSGTMTNVTHLNETSHMSPAAVVITAPIAYFKVVAAKKVIVGSWEPAGGLPRGVYCPLRFTTGALAWVLLVARTLLWKNYSAQSPLSSGPSLELFVHENYKKKGPLSPLKPRTLALHRQESTENRGKPLCPCEAPDSGTRTNDKCDSSARNQSHVAPCLGATCGWDVYFGKITVLEVPCLQAPASSCSYMRITRRKGPCPL